MYIYNLTYFKNAITISIFFVNTVSILILEKLLENSPKITCRQNNSYLNKYY